MNIPPTLWNLVCIIAADLFPSPKRRSFLERLFLSKIYRILAYISFTVSLHEYELKK